MEQNNPLHDLIPWDSDAEGVETTPSGLQYRVLKRSTEDGESPTAQDTVVAMYEGRLNDGTLFDGTYEPGPDGMYTGGRTATFPLGRVIPGWTEGLQLMSEGDEFVFYVPSALGYGDNPRPGGPIKPGDDLIFRVGLREVKRGPQPRPIDEAAWATYTPWDSEADGIVKTESGLEYIVLESGDEAGVSPIESDQVVVFYEGRFSDTGEVFDSAFKRGEPELFPANGVIPGWVEALSLMKPGDRWLVHIPSDLAYGATGYGAIPPNADLDFEVELMDIVPTR
ncbi:MAG: FKBP-type peptidyl-prolyl cis-trans isomerase [Pseudomonadota bacterium]